MRRCSLVFTFLFAAAVFSVSAHAAAPAVADIGWDTKPAKAYKKVPGSAVLTGVVNLVLRNHGPATAAPVYYTIKALAQYVELVSKVGSCKVGPGTEFHSSPSLALGPGYMAAPSGNGEIEIDCTIPKMPRSAEDPLKLVLHDAAQSAGWSQVDMSVYWEAGWGGPGTGGTDPNPANNDGRADLIFCGPTASDPGCKTAS
jgi:hypothetical protein